MVRRNLRSDFVGGAHVFPGGGVDPADGGPEAAARARGRSDAEASAILGVESGGLAYWVAVLRECFEEAGVLLAYGPGPGDLLSLDDPGEAQRFARLRQEVNAGRRKFLDVCTEEGLSLAVDRVHYFAHWITPEGAPRRYDTRFFVAAAPPGQVPTHDAGETTDAQWVRPAVALARHRAGEIELIFPTIRNLQAIGRFPTSAELLLGRRGRRTGAGHPPPGGGGRACRAHPAPRRRRVRGGHGGPAGPRTPRRRCPSSTPRCVPSRGPPTPGPRPPAPAEPTRGPGFSPRPRPRTGARASGRCSPSRR